MIPSNVTTFTRAVLNLLGLIGLVVALRWGEAIFIPSVMAVLLATLLWPTARWLHLRWAFPWSIACTTVVTGLVVVIIGVSIAFTLAITRIVQDLPVPRTTAEQLHLYERIRDRGAKILPHSLLNEYFPDPNAMKEDGIERTEDEKIEAVHNSRVFLIVKDALNPENAHIKNILWEIGNYGTTWMWQWVLILFMVLFLLLEGRMLSLRIVEVFGPSPEVQAKVVAALADMALQIRTFLVWRTIINFGLALVVGIVYSVLGLSYAWTWALITAVACYVPYLGPIAAGFPPVIDALLSCDSPWYAVGLLIFYVGIVTVEGYLLVPLVMGRSMEMNATTVIVTCIFWELVWGLSGLFLAMPVMAAIKTICWHVPGARPWANLMSTSEEPDPSAGREGTLKLEPHEAGPSRPDRDPGLNLPPGASEKSA